ncbi:MAG: flagellar biosynthesis protein FlhB [bacterium]
MAESEESFQEKTEQPSPKRKEEARKKGNVAKSYELNSALVLLTALSALAIFGGYLLTHLQASQRFLLGNLCNIELTPDLLPGYFSAGLRFLLVLLLPILLPILLVGVAVNLIQSGFLLSPEAIKPNLGKINPLQGIKKLKSRRSLIELIKGLIKILIVGWVGYITVAGLSEEMLPLMDQSVAAIFLWVGRAVLLVGFRIAAALLVLALLDFIYQRWEHLQQMKMTKEEVKEEYRQLEGDPKIKSKIRSIQLQTALQRMMKQVPTADVVITNPTEYAVALSYVPEKMSAPILVAKGKRLIAQRIREIALEHDIPIVENPPLAQGLYKSTKVGEPIPGKFYQAVAEILAYVYRLRNVTPAN